MLNDKNRVLVLLLMLLAFGRLSDVSVRLSATVDEGFHITAGSEYLHTGHVRLLDEHPPLIRAWMAWPLLPLRDLTPPQDAPGYAAGDLIQVTQATALAYRPLDRVIVPPRLMVSLLVVLLLAVVYRWAADGFGVWGGGGSLALVSLDPNLLAHGALATTDLGATLCIVAAVWLFARYLRRPTYGRGGLAALVLGMAQVAKLTSLLLLPLLGMIALLDGWQRGRWHGVKLAVLRYAAVLAGASLLVWAVYGFEVRPVPGMGLTLPAASHWVRLLRLRENLAYGRESFLLGQNGMHGWWLYFPLAFLVKTPPGTLILLLALPFFIRREHLSLREELSLGLFPVVYFLSALGSSIDIGYRHLLPVLPFLYVAMGRVAVWANIRARWRRWGLCALLCLTAVEGFALHPHYLTYFNFIAGGPDEGWRFLADSNTDWGQSLKELAQRQALSGVGEVYLSQFTFYDPAAYGVNYRPVAPMTDAPPVLPRRFDPQPGWYALSATTLDGVPLPYPPTFDWFRHREPEEKLGHALFVYHVKPSGGAWLAQCTEPITPLPDEAVAEGFGRDDLRRVIFDCEQTWVVPSGAGWYARAIPPETALRWPTRSRDERLPAWLAQWDHAGLQLSYVQPQPGELPPFALWWWPGGTITAPQVITENVGDVLTLLGVSAPGRASSGDTVQVLTFWQVRSNPARPLSLMLHLAAEDSSVVAVGDGLGFPVDQWRAGDVIIQRHQLSLPDTLPPGAYQLITGAYWLDDMNRLNSADGGILGTLHVCR